MEDIFYKIKDNCRLNNPASESDISQLEAKLNLNLPLEFATLLRKANGISDKFGTDLVWSTDKIFEQNIEFRANKSFKELYMSFENLLFFSEEGNGDLYAFVVLKNIINRDDIFLWEHETDSRVWFASNFEEFLERRLLEIL